MPGFEDESNFTDRTAPCFELHPLIDDAGNLISTTRFKTDNQHPESPMSATETTWSEVSDRYVRNFCTIGLPSVVFPTSISTKEGLPVCVMLWGAVGTDQRLIGLAAAIQAAMGDGLGSGAFMNSKFF